MNENLELMEYVYQDAEMAMYSIEQLIADIKEKDNKIKKDLEDILKEYEEYFTISKEMLEKASVHPKSEGSMAKMGASMGIKKEVKADNSDAAIADMLIKGIAMGSLDMEKKITQYKEEVDKEHLKQAEKFLKFQEKTIEKLKNYL